MSKPLIHIGLDAHAQTIAVAITEGAASTGEVRAHGSIWRV